MKHQYKQICVIFKATLFLCLSSVVFICLSQPQKITVYLGLVEPPSHFCRDTFVIENIDLRIKKGNMTNVLIGCLGEERNGRILLTATDTLYFGCRPVKEFYWFTGGDEFHYETTVDSVALRKFNSALKAFEEGDSTCLRNKDILWCDESPIVEDITLKTITLYIGDARYSLDCIDTLIIEDINLYVQRRSQIVGGGCTSAIDRIRSGRIRLTDTDALRYWCPLIENKFFWDKGGTLYPAVIDSTSLKKINNALKAFEESDSSCLRDEEW